MLVKSYLNFDYYTILHLCLAEFHVMYINVVCFFYAKKTPELSLLWVSLLVSQFHCTSLYLE